MRHFLVAVFALCFIGTACSRSANSRPTPTIVAPPTASTAESPASTPAISPAPPGALIFRTSGNAVGEIYRVNPDGTNLVKITGPGQSAFLGAPSPDGTRIALTRNNRVMLVNPDGSDPVDVGPGSFVSWSPDGARILYGNFGESYGEWWVMNRDGSGATMVVPRCGPCSSPQWLPDGRSLVAELPLDRSPATGVGLRVIGIDGAVVRELPGAPQDSQQFSVSPDGSQVAFTTGASAGTNAIDVVSVDGTGLHTVWRGREPRAPVWSPDSKRIAFISGVTIQEAPPSPPQSAAQLIALDPSSGAWHVLDGAASIDSVAWSPDGRTLAYAVARTAIDQLHQHIQVYVRPVEGGTPRNVSNGPWYDASPRWSHDGRQIYFGSSRASRDGVYWLDPVTSEPHLSQLLDPSLTSDEVPHPVTVGGCVTPPKSPGEGYVTGCLSPNGALRSNVADGRVSVSDVASSATRAISQSGIYAGAAPPAWSPDSTKVAFIGATDARSLGQDSWLYVMNISTGKATKLVHADSLANPAPSILWSRDGTTIYYTRGGYCIGGCAQGYLYRVGADGSGEQKLTDLRVVELYGFAP